MIPEETLQQILAATDIVDLIGRQVRLRRAGVNWVGLCPFHQEKSPSFNVNPQRGTYHCFGCKAGGNAFRFIMEQDGLSFMDAVKRLADAAGIRIEEEVWDASAERAAKIRQGLVKLHGELAEWFHHLLMKDPIAEPAREYLRKRGVNAQTAKSWQMGYAPAQGDLLRRWAAGKKYSENFLEHGGILARGSEESGRSRETYPRFRNRLMFPIRNDYGEVIAFSGRLLDADAKAAKYLNSPETVIFNKGRVLFGLHKSNRAIRKASQVIVCEGQLDLITAYEHGVENVVAPLGTAFTEHHARTLKRHADEAVLCFDSDTAGYKAAERAFGILAPTGIMVKIAPLPAGEDPDSMIRQRGVEAFQAILADARDFFDHMIDFATATRNLRETREKMRFAGEMANMIRLLDHQISRDAAIQKIAVRLGIPEADYRRQVARLARSQGGGTAQGREASSVQSEPPLPPQDKGATLLCRLALYDPQILTWLRSTGQQDILRDIPGTELLALIWNHPADLSDPAVLNAAMSSFGQAEQRSLSELLSQRMPEATEVEARQALEALEVKRLANLVQYAQSQLKQSGLDAIEIANLNQRVIDIRKEYLDRRSRLQKVSVFPTS